ncbi:unnamed protein product [Ectocarpus sp. CCAP 1310/34]|nr:unnamed protein product [Ectocarpus sp. CCAP 1310/34]
MNGMNHLFVKVDIGEGVEAVNFGSPHELLSEFWPLLRWAASSSDEIEDGLLYRWMKDASDYGASFSKSNKFFKLVAGETVAKARPVRRRPRLPNRSPCAPRKVRVLC